LRGRRFLQHWIASIRHGIQKSPIPLQELILELSVALTLRLSQLHDKENDAKASKYGSRAIDPLPIHDGPSDPEC
jgi:predicted lipid carrier protein YhbT